jgi:uncharacterized protein YndB with AHSA1/START domain
MPYSFERSIVIHATPEQVYANLLDVASHKNWGEMTELELLYEGPVKVGSRWRSTGVMGKDVMRDECTVMALERPRLFQFKSVSQHSSMGTTGMTFTYRLEQVPDGTRVTISRGFVPDEISSRMMRFLLQAGVVRLMDIFMTAKIIDRGLARLRDYVEQPLV